MERVYTGNLTVPSRKLVFPFKFVGRGREPRIVLDRPMMNLGQRLVNNVAGTGSFKIVNMEELPFHWEIQGELVDEMVVKPMKGVIQAKGETEILVKIKPREEKIYNINLTVQIRRKQTPLYINVKCEGRSNNQPTLST